ncbi:MAG: hypothetical protein PF589_02755 [Gammaproteobacteria bacterium]|jgi:hypothetical protein|nr:hypothetical protein [Gammaproteobacteria bacterium]
MNQPIVIPKWWISLAKFFLNLTVCAVFIHFFSSWAISAEFFGKYNHSDSIGYTILSVLSILIILGSALLAAVGIVVGVILEYPLKNYLLMLVISLASILYLYVFAS